MPIFWLTSIFMRSNFWVHSFCQVIYNQLFLCFAKKVDNFSNLFHFIVLVTSLGEIQWENPLNSIESRHISSVRRFFVKFLLSIMICLVFLICIYPFDVVPDEDVKYHGSQNKPVQRTSIFLIWVYTFGFAMGTFLFPKYRIE